MKPLLALSIFVLLSGAFGNRIPFPATQGKKVTWGYYFPGGQPYQTPRDIINQGVNYLAFAFGNIMSNGTFQFPGGGCGGDWQRHCWKFMESNGTAAAPTGAAFFKQLHDAGVAISITVGGAGATTPSPSADPDITLTSFKTALEAYNIYQYVDGIDFDWESTEATAPINHLAPAFKAQGYIVTAAPMASQLHGGCGYKWQGAYNDLAGMDADNVDGILVQWYQTSCANLGHCPKATCGKDNTPGCFDMDFATHVVTLFESVGACSSTGQENGKGFANCSTVASSCHKFPIPKIAIGVGLYYEQGQSDGLITSQNILDLDKTLGSRLGGAGAWDLNFGMADNRTKSFFPDLAKAWSLI